MYQTIARMNTLKAKYPDSVDYIDESIKLSDKAREDYLTTEGKEKLGITSCRAIKDDGFLEQADNLQMQFSRSRLQ
jgi:hypothetical protein